MACLTCGQCGAQTYTSHSGEMIEWLRALKFSHLTHSATGTAMQSFELCYVTTYVTMGLSLFPTRLGINQPMQLQRPVRPEFFYFSFYRPSRPTFLEIEKRDFFQFCFFISLRLMPVQYWSSVMFFRFVFSIAARLIKLPPVTAPGVILPF